MVGTARLSRHGRITSIVIAIGGSALLAGCAPAVLNEKPANWPDPWQGRNLCHTPRAYIYASSPDLAGQADRLAEEVAREFEKASGRSAPKGLLIMSDVKDPPVCSDLKSLFAASARSSKMRELGRVPTDAEMEESGKSFDTMKETNGCDPADALAATAIGLQADGLTECLLLPPEVAQHAGYGVVLPSDALVRAKMRKIMSDSLNHQKVGVMVRIAAAPVLLALEPKLIGMMTEIRKIVVFQQMALQQPDWSQEQVAKLSQAYAEGVLRPAMEAMQAEVQNQSTRATGKVDAASRPSSGPAPEPNSATQCAPASQPAGGPANLIDAPAATAPASSTAPCEL